MGIHPWTSTKSTEYSTAPRAATDVVLADGTANTVKAFSGALTKAFAEATCFVELGDAVTAVGSTSWTKIAEIDRGGVVRQLGSTAVLGFVDPKTGDFSLSFGAAPELAVRFSYKEDFQKNIPFGSGSGADNKKTYNTMKFDINRMLVEAKSRKLGASYSFEMMEDFKNEFGENFEDKMVDYLTTTILTEVDSEIIGMLYDAATTSTSWDATLPATWTRGVNAWYETIMPKINKLSNQIFQATHVSGANWLVCSPTTATIFQSMIQYVGTGNPTESNMSVGTTYLGSLSNMYNVYVSPLAPEGKILLGFKGSKPEETGAVYAPYVPVQLHPVYYSEGVPSILARSRYYTGVIRPNFYSVLNIDGTI